MMIIQIPLLELDDTIRITEHWSVNDRALWEFFAGLRGLLMGGVGGMGLGIADGGVATGRQGIASRQDKIAQNYFLLYSTFIHFCYYSHILNLNRFQTRKLFQSFPHSNNKILYFFSFLAASPHFISPHSIFQMKRQYLIDFDEKQLERYLATSKQRVNQMRQLTVTLQQQNADLSEEYTRMVNKKKHLYEESIKNKNHLLKWYDTGKEKVSGWISTFVKEEKNSYEPEIVENKEVGQEKKGNEGQENEEESKGGNIIPHFNFEELYQNGKEKIGTIIVSGQTKIRELATTLKEKYSSKKKQPEQPSNPQSHEVSEFQQTLRQKAKQQIQIQQSLQRNTSNQHTKL